MADTFSFLINRGEESDTGENNEDNEENEYVIVGSFETDPDNGKISNECPLAKAIMGRGVGDVVTVMVEEPYQVKVLEINVAE